MAAQTLTIGKNDRDATTAIDWSSLDALLDPSLLADGGTGYLHEIQLEVQSSEARIEVWTKASLSEPHTTAGPDFTDDVEQYAKAFVIEAGGLTLTIPGPNATGSVSSDGVEPYRWKPASPLDHTALQSFITSYRALTDAQKEATTLTITDGVPAVTIETAEQTVDGGQTVNLAATASDPDGDDLTLAWTSDGGGTFDDDSVEDASWTAPAKTNSDQTIVLTLMATDPGGLSASAELPLTVRANRAPSVTVDTADQAIDGGSSIQLAATDSDLDADTLTYEWESESGTFADPTLKDAAWSAPNFRTERVVRLTLTLTDPLGLSGSDYVDITVQPVQAARSDLIPILRSQPEYASGSRPLFPMTGLLVDARIMEDTLQQGGISFSALRSEEWVDAAVPGTVVWIDARGTPKEFWISTREDTYGTDGSGIVRFTADPLHTVLADVGIIELTTPGGITRTNLGGPLDGMSVTNYWHTFIRPWLRQHEIGYIELGSVESNERIKFSWANLNPQQLWNGLAERLGHEWRLRRDDAARNYKLDMGSELGSDLPVARATEGINLISLRRLRDREALATSIRPIGKLISGATVQADISQNVWQVPTGGVSGDDVQAEAHNGLRGPIGEDGQWAGHYLEAPDGTFWEIEGSVADTQTFELEAGAGAHFADGDDFGIVRDELGTGITNVSSPSAVARYGRIVRPVELDFRGERNWIRSPTFGDWPNVAEVHFAQLDGSHNQDSTVNLKGLPDGLVISAGDTLIKQFRSEAGRISGGGTVGSDGKVTITASSGDNPDNNNAAVVILSGKEPAEWSRGTTPVGTVLRRPLRSLPDLTCQLDGDHRDRVFALNLKGLAEEDVLYPGDLIMSGSNDWVVLEEAPAAAGGTVTAKTSKYVSGFDGDSVTVRRPLLDRELDSKHVAVLPALRSGDGLLSTAAVTVSPIAGLTSRVHATCRFTAMGERGWSITGSAFSRPPELRLKRDGQEVAVVRADDWVAMQAASQESFQLQTEPVDLSSAGDYSIEFEWRAREQQIFLHWVMLHVGETADIVPVVGSHATEGIQKAQEILAKDNDWASTYTAAIDELAERLEVSPKLIRANVGALIHVNSPELGVSGALRIKGLAYNPHDARTEVVLDRDVRLLTRETRRQRARTRFGEVGGQLFTTSEEPPRTPGVFRAAAVSETDLGSDSAIPVGAVL